MRAGEKDGERDGAKVEDAESRGGKEETATDKYNSFPETKERYFMGSGPEPCRRLRERVPVYVVGPFLSSRCLSAAAARTFRGLGVPTVGEEHGDRSGELTTAAAAEKRRGQIRVLQTE